MKRMIVAASLAFTFAILSAPSHAATDADCVTAITKSGGKGASSMLKTILKCPKKFPPGSNCNQAFLSEIATSIPSTEFAGKVRKALNKMDAGIDKGCAGADGIPGNADDTTVAGLNAANPVNSIFRGVLGWELDHEENTVVNNINAPPTITVWESDVEDECILLKGSPRIKDYVSCMVVNEVKALFEKLGPPQNNDKVILLAKSRFVKPNVTFDAGNDLAPPFGTNDHIAAPSASDCPLPGVGVCLASPTTTCVLKPGSGANPACTNCAAGLWCCGPCGRPSMPAPGSWWSTRRPGLWRRCSRRASAWPSRSAPTAPAARW